MHVQLHCNISSRQSFAIAPYSLYALCSVQSVYPLSTRHSGSDPAQFLRPAIDFHFRQHCSVCKQSPALELLEGQPDGVQSEGRGTREGRVEGRTGGLMSEE